MHTVTQTVLDEMKAPIIAAGSQISDTLICTLYDVHGIDRMKIDGHWVIVRFPKDKYGRRQLRLCPDFDEFDDHYEATEQAEQAEQAE